MKISLKNELTILIPMVLPLIFLYAIWSQLPETVPMHFNLKGEADRMGSKNELMWILILINVLTYLLLLFVPMIDPKKNIEKMGNKYTQLRWIITIFMAGISMVIIYSTKAGTLSSSLMLVLIGLLMAALGNYFQSVRPNYFIGIRTPWTLENEENWKATHMKAGKMWFFGGLFISALGFVIPSNTYTNGIFIGSLLFLGLFPIFYSFWYYTKGKKE